MKGHIVKNSNDVVFCEVLDQSSTLGFRSGEEVKEMTAGPVVFHVRNRAEQRGDLLW